MNVLFPLFCHGTMFTRDLSNPNDSPGFLDYHHPYRVAVYTNLFTGTILGEGQETRCRLISKPLLPGMIIGVYIIVYITSVYVLL